MGNTLTYFSLAEELDFFEDCAAEAAYISEYISSPLLIQLKSKNPTLINYLYSFVHLRGIHHLLVFYFAL